MLRFPLAELLSSALPSFENIQFLVPEIGVHLHAHPMVPGGGRLIKTHEPYRREYKRAIYVFRDVRDVMLSNFARETAMGSLHVRNLDDYIVPFLRGKMTRFGSWQRHVEGWLNSPLADRGGLLWLCFEEARNDLAGAIARCMEFLGLPANRSAIQTAVRNNSLEHMRVKEDRATKLPKSSAEEGRQVGTGAIEGWRRKFSLRQLEIIDELASEQLVRLGYPLGTSKKPTVRQTYLSNA
jgi:hypothetical protein